MALPKFLYGHPLDNFLRTATSLTLSVGNALDGYGLDALYDGVPGNPLKVDGIAATIVGQWSSPIAVGLAALLHTNLSVAAQLQGHSSNTWGAPNISLAFGVPTVNARGLYSAPRLVVDETEPQAWWRLVIAGNSLNVILGEFYLGRRRELDGFVFPGVRGGRRAQNVRHPTYFGVPLTYELAPAVRGWTGSVIVSGDTDRQAVVDLQEATRYGARQFVGVPRSDQDKAFMFALSADQVGDSPRAADTDEIDLPLEEVSPGVSWVDPDEL